ncbi:MAG: large conductance mechanosensitive channel protein MscL, partial [Pseudomonadota bacterium]
MLTEFKEFIAKGNVMELAVAVIIAGAFAVIVASMTSDLIMPIVGLIFGDVDFSNKYIVLSGEVEAGMSLEAAREAGANVLAWGAFVTAVINFVILAFIIFLLVRYAERAKAKFEK